MTDSSQPAVVLVHGLFMKPWAFRTYQRFLQDHGFRVYLFGYHTTARPFESSVMKLVALVNSRTENTVHLVAHSMGGLLSMRALPEIHKAGKLVMLGSPVKGSKVAKKLQQIGWHKGLLNHATEPLTVGLGDAVNQRETLMIAGTSPYGLGRFIEPRLGPSDGTVALHETEADWIDHHQTIHSNHIGLLRNKQALQTTLDFLQN